MSDPTPSFREGKTSEPSAEAEIQNLIGKLLEENDSLEGRLLKIIPVSEQDQRSVVIFNLPVKGFYSIPRSSTGGKTTLTLGVLNRGLLTVKLISKNGKSLTRNLGVLRNRTEDSRRVHLASWNWLKRQS